MLLMMTASSSVQVMMAIVDVVVVDCEWFSSIVISYKRVNRQCGMLCCLLPVLWFYLRGLQNSLSPLVG